MPRKLLVLLGFLGVFGLYLLAAPVPIDPVAWSPMPDPGRTGVFEANERLSALDRLAEGRGSGPEGTTIGPDGLLYTGYEDGRIVRFDPVGDGATQVEEVANTGGRPLGLQFAADGTLVVADALKGLLAIAPSGEVRVLTDSVGGERMLFVDDLDIARDGKVWFSDASTRFDIHDNLLDFMESRATGRLVSFDPATGATKVELDNLGFANGVALAQDESYVLVNETFRHRVTRFWLTGPRAGEAEPFIENLPAFPDNITRAPDGRFWVALVLPRAEALDRLMPYPFWRKVMMRLPEAFRGAAGEPYGWVIALDEAGEVVENLQDPTGRYGTITSVMEKDGYLYLGSLAETAVGKIAAP